MYQFRYCFRQLNENMDVSHLGPEETNPHVLRVGWSTDNNNMLLGNQGVLHV